MTTHEFKNDSNQSERRRVERDTYLTRAQSDADLTSQGRFKKETATRVTGVPEYPKQPANSFWSCDPVPATQPLGFSVDAMEPNGTPTEVEASLKVVGVEAPPGADDLGGSMAPTDASLSDVETGPPKPERSKR
jgi:hypothetical protein